MTIHTHISVRYVRLAKSSGITPVRFSDLSCLKINNKKHQLSKDLEPK